MSSLKLNFLRGGMLASGTDDADSILAELDVSGKWMIARQHQKRHPTILAFSEDRNLVALLLRICSRRWEVKVADDFASYLNLVSCGECKLQVIFAYVIAYDGLWA
jgi:hypothetical protein